MPKAGIKSRKRCPVRQVLFVLACFAGIASADALAQASVYRCLGNPVMYTSDQRLAQAKNCTPAGGGESPTRTAPARRSAADVATSSQINSVGSSVTRVASTDSPARSASPEQKARDSDRLTILTAELRDEKAKFEALKQKLTKTSTTGFASDDIATDLNKALARSQSDITALEREISRAH
jgi:hypothetical protein